LSHDPPESINSRTVSQLLEKARAFCLNSQNCIAGNTLPLEAQQLLKEAQEMLGSMLS
jgi:hypothetical protein